MLSDAEYELERELCSLRAELIRERRARELRAEISQLAASTSAESDRAGVAQAIANGTADILDAGWAFVAYVGDDAQVTLKHGPGMPPDVAADWAMIPLETPVPLCDVLRGEHFEIALQNRAAFDAWPLLADGAERAQLGSLVVRRFETTGKTTAAVALGWPRSHSLDEGERELLDLLVRATAPAFERSGRTEVAGDVARTLQTWVLESRISDIRGVDVEALYEPGSDLLAVGGDWFDVIDLGDGRAAAVVGDVVGHDVKAAVAMSQVRHVLAAHLVAGRDAAAALDLTDTYLGRRTDRVMATAVVIVFEGEGLITVASAGHPPPVVDIPGRGCAPLDTALGPPLGSGLDRHGSRQTRLPPGSTIVAYTDGVVEERGESVDDGIAALIDALAATAEVSVAEGAAVASAVAEMLRTRLAVLEPTDDSAALVLHLRAQS